MFSDNINGPANSDLCPPHTSASSLALTEMAGPTIKLATGPRPIGEIMGQLRAAIGQKG